MRLGGASAPTPSTTMARIIRVVALGVVVLSLAGLVALGFPTGPADAASTDDSSVTVAWTGDTSADAGLQPARVASKPHFADLEDITVTVSQTENLIDQAIRVSMTGFHGGTTGGTDGTGASWRTAMNFMQAMQCWGDPASPTFRQTCQWGGRYGPAGGLGGTVYSDNALRVDIRDLSATSTGATDVPFVTAGGTTVSGRQQLLGDGSSDQIYPIYSVFSPATTNEQSGARVRSDGTGFFDFEVQTADQAPQLGCGGEGHLRCYLVLVPRGSFYGGVTDKCSPIIASDFSRYVYGRPSAIQAGSPLNPACDYWDNRMVVPLDFNPVGQTCALGTAEQRVIGSQLLIGAMGSWQPKLCTAASTTYSFATNPDSVARLQLLGSQATLAFGSQPVVKAQLNDATAEGQFDRTTLSYAPIAIGAASVAFFAEGPNGRISTMNLTPRLMAKLLTQSYVFEVPFTTSAAQDNIEHLPVVNRGYARWVFDPDVQAANPNWQEFTSNPAIVLPGPAGADAILQVWKWILADPDARDFLDGKADDWGMTVNPYYLPYGHPNAKVPAFDEQGRHVVDQNGNQTYTLVGLRNLDGSPMSLADAATDYFLKADETQVPFTLTGERTRFDSLQAFPYTETFLTAARDSFRADPHSKITWDPNKDSGSGAGDWVSTGPQPSGSRFMIAVTDLASARRYSLDVANLQVKSGDFVAPDNDTMLAALSAAKPVANTAVSQVDPASVGSNAYPLTTVIYATTNLTSSTAAARKSIASFIRYVTGPGQNPGVDIGDLPVGYLPLPAGYLQQASAAAVAIESYSTAGPTPNGQTSFTSPTTTGNGGSNSGDDSAGGAHETPKPTSGPEITDGVVLATDRTAEVADSGTPRTALAVALALGLLGAIGAPLLLRGPR